MLTKRQLLQYVGSVAGAAGVYRTMATLGMLGVSSLTGCSSESAVSQSMGDGKRVVILGAGIAGLVAAYELSNSGYDCEILEATSRAGGRNLTVRGGDVIEEIQNTQRVEFDEEDHLYANMGPARIPYHHETILGYCKKLNVELEVFTNDNRAAYIHGPNSFGGVPVEARRLYTDQRGYIAELAAKAVNGGLIDDELTEADKLNLLAMLRSFGALGNDHQYKGSDRAGYQGSHLQGGLNAAPTKVEPLGLQELLGLDVGFPAENFYPTRFTHGLDQNPTLFQPVGGMDRIVDAFEREVGDLISHDIVVERIWNKTPDRGVTVGYLDTRSGNRASMDADYVICTIPAPVLAGITNNFADATQQAIEDTIFAKAVKIAFQAPRRFWEEDHQIYGGISWTTFDGVTQIWYPANGYHREKGVILGAYIFGMKFSEEVKIGYDAAVRFAAMTPSQRLNDAIKDGMAVHPDYEYELKENGRLNGVSRAWSEVRYQRGSWHTPVGSNLSSLRMPNGVLKDGDVHFAGDQTADNLYGWQEGAALSAFETAQAIRDGRADMDM